MILFFCAAPVWADDVDDRILSYDGDLVLHEDNTADFKQVITYQFDSDYNGQYVTLGEQGVVGPGFSVEKQPQVVVKKNDQEVQVRVEELSKNALP